MEYCCKNWGGDSNYITLGLLDGVEYRALRLVNNLAINSMIIIQVFNLYIYWVYLVIPSYVCFSWGLFGFLYSLSMFLTKILKILFA